MNCKKCGTELQDNVRFCSDCGASTETTEDMNLGMRWYKFTAYFRMPVYAFFDAVTGVLLLPNMLYKLIATIPNAEYIEPRLYFLNFGSIKICNLIYALAMFAFAVYYVYISFSLIKFKKDAPKHVYISIISGQVIGLIYFAAMLILLESGIEFDTDAIMALVEKIISTIVTTLLWMLINTGYFNKRKHLFVN